MEQGYQGQQPISQYQQQGGYRQQQQGQMYQNQQYQHQQQPQYPSLAVNRGQNQLQQNSNIASPSNQYDNYPQQQLHIEEESYDSSNVNNYTGDQYKQQQQKEYQNQQPGNFYKNGNQMQQHQNFFQDDHAGSNDQYYEVGSNPSAQYYNSMPSNYQGQNPLQGNKEAQNQIYYNDIYGMGKKQNNQQSSDPNDSLASDINEDHPFEGFEDLFDRVGKDFKDNRVNEALDVCEQMIFSQQRVKGPASFMKLFQQILKFLNNEAVNSLNQNQFEKSLFILIKCKELTELNIIKSPPSIRALTFNNFGCYYRRLQQLPKALGYLEQALRFLNSIKSRDYLGMTFLNISAVLSQMNEHYASLENAKKAVIEIHKDYQNYLARKNYEEAFKDQEFIDICQALAIAFYNVGVEQEYFQNYEVSLINYGKACEVSEDNLGANHRLTRRFKELFQKFNEKLVKAEKQQNQLPKNRKVRPASGQQKFGLNKNKSFQNNSIYSNNENGSERDYNNQYLQNKVNPFRQSYGVKASDFTSQGKNVYYKGGANNLSQPLSRIQSAKQIPNSKTTRPNSSKNIYPEVRQNINQLNRPLSAKFQSTPSGGFFANSLTPKPKQQGLNRPFSAQANQNNQIGLNQNKPAPQKSSLSRPQNKAKNQNKDIVNEGEDGNQHIYDWVDSPTNSSYSGGTSKKVLDNQKEFLKNIKSDAEAQIQKLQQEEQELKERIQKLKQEEENEQKQRQQKLEDLKKKEEEDATRAKQNFQKEEEEERQRLAEIYNLKKREQEELEKLQKARSKGQEAEMEIMARLKEQKKKEEEEIERLKQQRTKEEEDKQKKLTELEKLKQEEERRLREIKEKAEEEMRKIQELETKKKQFGNQQQEGQQQQQNNSESQSKAEEERIKKEKDEIIKRLEEEKAEKERIKKEYERIKQQDQEKEKIQRENQELKEEKEKLLQEIKKLQNQGNNKSGGDIQNKYSDEKQISQKIKYHPNFECQIVKRLNDNYEYGIQTNKRNQIIVHVIPLWVDDNHPHFNRSIDLSNISERSLKEDISNSLIQLILNTIKIKHEKKKIKFDKKWQTIVDNITYDCKLQKNSQKELQLIIEDKQNLPVITSVVQQSLDSTLKKVIDEVSPRVSLHQLDDNSDKIIKQEDQKEEDQGIPEDEQTVEKVKLIQEAYRIKKTKEKAKEEKKKTAQEQKQSLQNRVIQYKQHKLFLQCFKQITPEQYIVQVDSLNPKQLKLPKISDTKQVEKQLIDRIILSENPFTFGLIIIDEEKGKISFIEEEENFEEEYLSQHSDKNSPAISDKKSKKKEDENYDYSFDSISDGENNKKDKKKEKSQDQQKDQLQQQQQKKEEEVDYNEEQKLAAVIIQNAVLSKKQKQKKQKEKVILVQTFVQKFDQKFIFQLYRKVEAEKIKDQVSFENLLKKPSRWFAKLNIPAILSQEIILKNKENKFTPLDYFDLLQEEQQIVLTELARGFAAQFIKKVYDSYYKEVFFQIEKVGSEKFLFSLSKLVRKAKEGESVYRIRTESMKDRKINSITPINCLIAKNLLKLKQQNQLTILDIFTLNQFNAELKIIEAKQISMSYDALKDIIPPRLRIRKIRKEMIKIEYKRFIQLEDYPRNKYLFCLYINKKTKKYYASIDTVKFKLNTEKVKAKAELKSYQYKIIKNDALFKKGNFNFQDYFQLNSFLKLLYLTRDMQYKLNCIVASFYIQLHFARKKMMLQAKKIKQVLCTHSQFYSYDLPMIFIVKNPKNNTFEITLENLRYKYRYIQSKVKRLSIPITEQLAVQVTEEIKQEKQKIKYDPNNIKLILNKYFQINYLQMSISIRKQFESKVLTHLTKKFKGDISSALTLAVILNKTDNSLIFQCEDKIQNYQEYEVKLQNEFEDEDLLIEQAKQIFDRLIIDINIIREVTQEEEKAVKIIQKHAKNEVLIKKQFFSLRLNDDNGDIQLVQGECHIIRKMDNDSIDDPNARLTEQQKIKIGRLNKQQMQHLFANFQTLINSNITILQENLAFEDINMFLNPQSIQISRISFQ